MMNPYRLWRLRRGARDLDFDTAWQLFHFLHRIGADDHRELMVALTERARDTATDRGLRAASDGWRKAYAGGRRVRTKVFAVESFRTVQVPLEMVAEIEDALTNGDELT